MVGHITGNRSEICHSFNSHIYNIMQLNIHAVEHTGSHLKSYAVEHMILRDEGYFSG